MKVLLHLGQSKTGTSAIQAFLTLNRGKLEKHGVLYPAIRIKGMPINLGAHNAVADSLLNHIRFPHKTADEYFKQFFDDARASKADQLILSAEHFFGGEPRIWEMQDEAQYFELYSNKIRRLAGYLRGCDVSMIVYLRPQVDWISSAVSQTVRIERLMSTRQIYQNDRNFFELMKPLLRYADLAGAWQSGIQPAAFTVVPYDRKTLHKNSSIADFLLRTGLDALDFDYASTDIQVNDSLTREFIEVKKVLNRTPRSKIDERAIIRCLESLSRQHPGNSSYALDPDVQGDIEAFVADQNDEINRRYMKDGLILRARSSSVGKAELVPSAEDVRRALAIFETEYRQPRYNLLRYRLALLAFLRLRAKPVHAALHQLKVAYWKMKYRS